MRACSGKGWSLQEALSNLWLRQGLFRAPKWASELQEIVQGVTQRGAEEMGAVWQTQAERGVWGRWEAFHLDLAREERDKSVPCTTHVGITGI